MSHANRVGGVAGIYPVCNIASYPGVSRAAPAFGMTTEELKRSLEKYNPVDKLESLAKAGVPVFHIQGDSDKVVPHEDNSGLLASRYRALGGSVEIELIPGQGHNMWRGWFESESLTEFMIKQSLKKGFPSKCWPAAGIRGAVVSPSFDDTVQAIVGSAVAECRNCI